MKIAIAGYGIEGQALYEYFRRDPSNEILVFAEALPVECKNTPGFFEHLIIPKDREILYRSPGIPFQKLTLLSPETFISSLTDVFLEKVRDRTIAVTGTKGKSTVASLIHHILKSAGKKVFLVGNIGTAGLSLLENDTPDTWYVYEMSSYQCEALTVSPHIAVILSIFPAHIDHHGSFENYRNAKLNSARFQSETDYLITESTIEKIGKGTHIPIVAPSKEEHVATKLLGDHNQYNIALALKAAEVAGIPRAGALLAIATFDPLPYRIEKVFEAQDITFIDDSLATVPGATLASIQALANVNTIILGGQDIGLSFEDFAQALTTTSIKNFIIFPDTGEKMVSYVTERNIRPVTSMEEAVRLAYTFGPGICLLSSGSPSLNMFKGYKDKSAQYRFWIENCAKELNG